MRFALPERKHRNLLDRGSRFEATKCGPCAAQGAEEQDPTRWRRQRFEAHRPSSRPWETDDDDDQRPGPREMPPPHTVCKLDENAHGAENEADGAI